MVDNLPIMKLFMHHMTTLDGGRKTKHCTMDHMRKRKMPQTLKHYIYSLQVFFRFF